MIQRRISLLFALLIWVFLPGRSQTITKGEYQFTFSTRLDSGPVEDQASTGTCWSFSTGSFLQTEALRQGQKPVNLSEMFYVRLNYLEKGELYLRYQGTNNFDEGSLTHDVIRLYRKFGAMPEAVYSGLTDQSLRHNHGRLKQELHRYLDDLVSSRNIPKDWKTGFNAILDKHLGELPDTFYYEDDKHTSLTFAAKYLDVNPSDYLTLTSFSHHNDYSAFILEIPDNYSRETYFNVPLEDLVHITDQALINGYSVVWDCDVSERGFSARQGLAIVPPDELLISSRQSVFDKPSPELQITPELRQEEFDNYSLTDDHLMHIVGLAHDQQGKTYYYVKNSWGKDTGLDGYLFASQPYFQLNTISITVNRQAIPSDILEKIIPIPAHTNE
jgi:bleomycin hydrolase